jgi:Na+-transporting methylmalonyl-CoA/oxaloacetate decarboxylase gamma subunit
MILLASSLPAQPSFAQNLQYQLTGLLVVFFTLGALALMVWLLGKVFVHAESDKTKPEEQTALEDADEIPGPVLAAISAAVAVAMEGRHFVIYDVSAASGTSRWSAEGRRAIYRSHNLR